MPRRNISGGLGGKILVVEDQYLLGTAIAEQLREFGFEVMGPLGSAAVAQIAALTTGEVDGAVVDYVLQDGDARNLASLLREKHVPFFFLTGYSAEYLQDHGCGGGAMLEKPWSPGELKKAIEHYLHLPVQ